MPPAGQAKLTNVYAASPLTERGSTTRLGRNIKMGKWFLYCNGRSVFLRDLKNPLIIDQYFEHQHKVTTASFSPSGRWVASGDASGNVKIFAPGYDNEEHPVKLEVRALSRTVKDIDWSGDSKRVVAVGDGSEKFGHVFDWNSGASIGEIMNHSKCINSVSFKQDRPFRIVTGGDDMTCNFYKGPPFKFQHSIADHSRFVTTVRYCNHDKGAVFATCSSDKTIFTYDGKEGTKLAQIKGGANHHKGGIYDLAWGKGAHFITASADKTVKLWDVEKNAVVSTFTIGTDVNDQQYGCLWDTTTNFTLSLSLSGAINYLDMNSGTVQKVVAGHREFISALAYDNARKSMVSGSRAGRLVKWQFQDGSNIAFSGKNQHKSQVTRIVCLANGSTASAAMDDTVKIVPESGNIDEGSSAKLSATPRDMCSVGNALVCATWEDIQVLKAGKVASNLPIKFKATSIAAHPDGKTVAVGGDDNKVYIYTLSGTTLSQTQVLVKHRKPLTALTFSRDGAHLASADANKDILVWKNDGGEWSPFISGWCFHDATINDLDFSPDNFHLASASSDQNIFIWNLKKKLKRIKLQRCHVEGVRSVTWINEKTLMSAGHDASIKTWDITYNT